MIEEVDSAIGFLMKLLNNTKLNDERLDSFKERLQFLMVNHYQNHWFPEKPFKGSGYRCLRIVNQKMDPLISKAGAVIGLSEEDLLNILPREFTMWVDPREVSYRIGEEGSIGVLFGADADSSEDSDDGESSRTHSPPIVITAPENANSSQLQSQEFLQNQQQQHSCKQQLRSSPPHSGASSSTQDSNRSLNNWEFMSQTTYVSS